LVPEVLERLRDAQNSHDLDAFVACFDPQYRSEQPVHPDRAFVGSEQARKNWAEVFAGVPDFQAELLRLASQGDTEWAEWHWHAPAPIGHGSTCAGSPSSGSATTASTGVGSTWKTLKLSAKGFDQAVRHMARGTEEAGESTVGPTSTLPCEIKNGSFSTPGPWRLPRLTEESSFPLQSVRDRCRPVAHAPGVPQAPPQRWLAPHGLPSRVSPNTSRGKVAGGDPVDVLGAMTAEQAQPPEPAST
jgi:SnoaL-like domain